MDKHRYSLVLIGVITGMIGAVLSYGIISTLILFGVTSTLFIGGAALIDFIDFGGDT